MSYVEQCVIFRRPELTEKVDFHTATTKLDCEVNSLTDTIDQEKRWARTLLPHEPIKANSFFSLQKHLSPCKMMTYKPTITGDLSKGNARIVFKIAYQDLKSNVVFQYKSIKLPKNMEKLANKFQRKHPSLQQFVTMEGSKYQVIYQKSLNNGFCTKCSKTCSTAHESVYSILLKEGEDPINATILIKFYHRNQGRMYQFLNFFGLAVKGDVIPQRIEVAK